MAIDLLDKLNKELNQEQNKSLKVDKNPRLEAIIQCFEKHIGEYYIVERDHFERHVCNLFKKTDYTYNDVLAFCIELKNLEAKYENINSPAGGFTNNLIKHISKKEIHLNLSHLDAKLSWLCSGNLMNKKISLIGDLRNIGYFMSNGFAYLMGDVEICGYGMISGKIQVNGDVNELADYMCGGKIVVNGDVTNMRHICGGVVEVFGDVKNEIFLNQGMIKLHGNYRLYNSFYDKLPKTLNFYHQNKLLIKNGKPVKGAEIKWR